MNFFTRSERLEMIDGELCRIVTAYGKDKAHAKEHMDVLRHFENGKKFIRNIEYKGACCGWLIAWPSYTYHERSYGYSCPAYVAELDPWQDFSDLKFDGFSYHKPTIEEKDLILSKYPEFKWIFKKSDLTTEEIFHILPEWKAHPQQVEMLLGAGYEYLALNKNIYKLKNARPILEWLKAHPGNKYITLGEIQGCLKYGCTLEEWNKYCQEKIYSFPLPFDCWKHMMNALLPNDQTESVYSCAAHYKDYLNMAKKAGHNINENYWRFPKDLRLAHNKVMKELQRIEDAAKEKELIQKQKEYTAAVAKLVKKTFTAAKLNVFVPSTINEIKKQAESLHQCLIRCDYVKKVIEGRCILVFVEKAGKPYATCELKPRGKKFTIGQFYGNEKLKNYIARPDAKKALNEWAIKNKVKILTTAA